MGCLFVLLAGIFPRLGLFIVWVARPNQVDAAFSTWIWPLLGFIFLPFATLMYVVLWQGGRPERVGLVLGGPGRPAGSHARWRELDAAPAGTGLPSGCPGLTRPTGCRWRLRRGAATGPPGYPSRPSRSAAANVGDSGSRGISVAWKAW